jgi:hypothetical protein
MEAKEEDRKKWKRGRKTERNGGDKEKWKGREIEKEKEL